MKSNIMIHKRNLWDLKVLLSRCVVFAFNIPPPHNAKNMFGNWLRGITGSIKKILVGGSLSSCIPIESTFDIPCYHKRAGYYMHNGAILLESVSKDILFYGWCSSITIVG
uniref:Uncharacterized protein n=1 Tax=Oryza barthii TaxID=65489 RepID=A0A0D3HUU2_9ORYZ